MRRETVAVLSASGRPGRAQVRQLQAAGYDVRPITRQKGNRAFAGMETRPADYNDPASLRAAIDGADVVFFTSATFTQSDRATEHAGNVGRAARDAGVRRLVYNTTSWHPEKLIGVPSMDRGFLKTQALRETGVPLTVVRPSLFMDNLLTKWVKPILLQTNEFSYPHKKDLQVSWICLDDVGRFMISALQQDGMAGQTVDVGGPETLMPTQVATLLGETLGRPIAYRQITPREFGERMADIFLSVSGQNRETYVSNLEKHYLFKNETNPFLVDHAEAIRKLPIKATTMREWLKQQDWSEAADEQINSVSG